YQILNSSWNRSPSDPVGKTDGFRFKRRDAVLRAFAAARPDGLGPRLELVLATTRTGKDDSVTGRSVSQRMVTLSSAGVHAGAGRWDGRRGAIEVGGARRDPLAPIGRPSGLKPLAGLSPTPRTRYLTVHGSAQPLPGLLLSGWYFNPLVQGGNDFEPPYHARLSATLYSKFW